jgi:hypothetical protein
VQKEQQRLARSAQRLDRARRPRRTSDQNVSLLRATDEEREAVRTACAKSIDRRAGKLTSSVMMLVTCEISRGIWNSMSEVTPSCFVSPLTWAAQRS